MINPKNLLKFTSDEINSPFLISDDSEISYGDLKNLLAAASVYLKSIFENDEKYIVYLFRNRISLVIYLLAGWQNKIVPVIINPVENKEEIKALTEQTGCRFILSDIAEEIKDKVPNEVISALQVSDLTPAEFSSSQTEEESAAVVLFTSGTSGKPSAVELKFRHLIASTINAANVFRFNSSDRWLASLPFYHIGGFSIIVRALYFRSAIIIPEELKRSSLCESINKFNPTLLSLVSPQIKTLVDENCSPPENLRAVFAGGGFIDYHLASEAAKRGWKINIVYGSTETSSMITALQEKELFNIPDSSGKPLPGNEISILNENYKNLNAYQEGEIAVRGKSVINKYFNDPEADKNKFFNGWYLTGDTGYINSEGYLFVTGRKTNLISTGGKKVHPEEVESEIRKFSFVEDVCVAGKKDPEWGEAITALIVLKNQADAKSDEIISELKLSLPEFKIPKIIRFVESLPHTETGKINRKEVLRIINSDLYL
ncbi:MAG: o-succinylbenzoate--CoA ligase [Ignavibacteriaceae bacterium]